MKKLTIIFLLPISIVCLYSCNKEGCTDQTAMNYDENADNDDGSCIYDEDGNGNGNGGSGSGGVDTEDPDYNLAGTVSTPTVIEDVYDSDELFDYYIDGTWSISGPVEIEPGVRILMKSGARVRIDSDGSLKAEGTNEKQIHFIGDQDVEGYWDYILFDASNNLDNKFNYVTVRNAGASSTRPANIYLRNASRLSLKNSTVSKSSSNGLEVSSTDGVLFDFENNHFSENQADPIKLASWRQASEIDYATNFTDNNGFNRLRVGGGGVIQNTTVNKVNGPFYFDGSANIDADLTFTEGVTVLMGPGARFRVTSSGGFISEGTQSERVTIKGYQEVPGYWDYIQFDDSNNPNNSLSYTDVSHGGASSTRPGNIYLRNSSILNMGNSSSNYSSSNGVDGGTSATFNDQGGNSYEGNTLDDNTLN